MPEKREFFLEGLGLFAFGGVAQHAAGQGGGRPPIAPVLFFSRRIGLADEDPVQILAGGRVTGRVGRVVGRGAPGAPGRMAVGRAPAAEDRLHRPARAARPLPPEQRRRDLHATLAGRNRGRHQPRRRVRPPARAHAGDERQRLRRQNGHARRGPRRRQLPGARRLQRRSLRPRGRAPRRRRRLQPGRGADASRGLPAQLRGGAAFSRRPSGDTLAEASGAWWGRSTTRQTTTECSRAEASSAAVAVRPDERRRGERDAWSVPTKRSNEDRSS